MRERLTELRAAWSGERLVARLLAIETAATVPFFLLSWLLSAIVFAVVSGWRQAQLETAKKRVVLEKLAGVASAAKPDTK